MSLQDESFPDDEFPDELEFSITSGNRFQFPKNCSLECKPATMPSSNTSSSSTDQNLSSESSNDRPASDLSGKTSKSDPTGLTDATSMNGKHQGITTSYMDIHSEYTKRRFKHVESKVGQYIASMKAEDQKRKNFSKFQRHRSMPETLGEHKEDAKITGVTMGVSATELRKLRESTSDVDADLSENITSSSRNHESSVETILIDKKTYTELLGEKERIQSYSDYLQTKLDEKSSEVLRLKRNIDYLRIEVGNYKDKLKRQPTQGAVTSYNNAAIFCGLTRQTSLHALANCQTNNNNKQTKATQTEMITPSPQSQQRLLTCDVCGTPETPDDNNNTFHSHSTEGGAVMSNLNSKTIKCVAAIQPLSLSFSNMIEQDKSLKERTKNGILRQRTNSNEISEPQRNNNYSGRSCPSSSDSAIDIESVEANSPKLQGYRRNKMYDFDKRSTNTRHNSLETLNTTNVDYVFNENKTLPKANERDSKTDAKKHKKNSLRWRMLRIFGPCAGCNDRNRSLDVSGLTQIPLLDKSPESFCRTMR